MATQIIIRTETTVSKQIVVQQLQFVSWHGVGRPQVAMHSQMPRFLVLIFSININKLVKQTIFISNDFMLRSCD